MKELFTELVKDIGISILLTAEKIPGVLDVYCYEWISNDGKFYSVIAACNDTEIFTDADISLAESKKKSFDKLRSNLQVYETKEEWSACATGNKKIEEFLQQLRRRLECLQMEKAVEGSYSIGECKFYMRPAFGVCLKVWKNNRFFDSITVWKNAVTRLPYKPEDDLAILFKKLHLDTKITWIERGEEEYDIRRVSAE